MALQLSPVIAGGGSGGGGGGAPTDATYVTLTTNGTLTQERVLTGTANQVVLTDNGAGSTIVLSLPQSIGTASDVQFNSVTVANTGLHILDSDATHDLIIKPGSNLTADRNFTIVTGDAARTVTMAGDLNIAADFITSGANSLTLTTTGSTNVTLPTTGTVATLAGTEALSNKTLTAAKIVSGGFIADANGNELIIFTTVAASVNEITFSNGSTGQNPKFTASGETNVGIDLQAKGTGVYRLLGTASQGAELRLLEDTDDGSNFTAFKMGTQGGDITYTLPTINAVGPMYNNGSGVLSWNNNAPIADIYCIVDGLGATITTGVKLDLRIDFACTIVSATVLLDQSGSIVFDVWKDTLANYPPVVGDSITASAKPTVSSTTNSTDTTLTGWTTAIAAGDTLRFNVDSITTAQRAVLILKVVKT